MLAIGYAFKHLVSVSLRWYVCVCEYVCEILPEGLGAFALAVRVYRPEAEVASVLPWLRGKGR